METRRINPEEAAARLLEADNILILTHKNPDGDAIGSGIAIALALQQKGKHCRVCWTGELAGFYSLITGCYQPDEIGEPDFVLAVDLANPRLLPEDTIGYSDSVDMVIDHHATSVEFARETLLESAASCCAEIIFKVINAMGCSVTTDIANCIYVGLSTDTGCFRYSNTTADNHLLAAQLVSLGVNIAKFNELIFGQKSRARIEIERRALSGWKCVPWCLPEVVPWRLPEVELTLGPGESGFVVLGKEAPYTSKRQQAYNNKMTAGDLGCDGTPCVAKRQQAYNNKEIASSLVIEGPWKVSFDPAWGGPKDEVEFKTLEDWTKRPEWGIQHYSGIATYRKTVTSKEAPTHISLGDVANLARVKLNGKDLGSVWCWPWRVAVPKGAWKDGENLLEIEVANLWANRLIGDASLPAEKRLTRTTVNPHKPTDPLRRSGLFGPVKLESLPPALRTGM